jgi:hypothetical protein
MKVVSRPFFDFFAGLRVVGVLREKPGAHRGSGRHVHVVVCMALTVQILWMRAIELQRRCGRTGVHESRFSRGIS